MKKILTILLILYGFVANAQIVNVPGYTTINSRYQDLGRLFNELGLPAGGNATFKAGQAQRAGSVYYDSTGSDAGFYIYTGTAWVLQGSPAAAALPDELIQPGYVIYSGTGLKFYITASIARIDGIIYGTTYDSVTLSAADPTNPRKDVIYLATTGVEVEEGVPAGPAAEPQLDGGTIKLTVVDIPAGATTPGIITEIVYDENIEWTVSHVGTTIDPDQTSIVYRLFKALNVTNINTTDYIIFTNGSTVDKKTYDGFSFFILPKANIPTSSTFRVSFWNAGIRISNVVTCNLNRTNLTWQGIGLDVSNFTFSNDFFDQVRIQYINSAGSANYTGFYLDYVHLQKGIQQPGSGESGVTAVGDINTKTASPNGAVIEGNRIYFNNATQTTSGPMSADDKAKLDSIRRKYFLENGAAPGNTLLLQTNDSTAKARRLIFVGADVDSTDEALTITIPGGSQGLQDVINVDGFLSDNSSISLGSNLFIGDNVGMHFRNIGSDGIELFGPSLYLNRGFSGAAGTPSLPSGSGTDSIVTINDATGKLGKRSVASIGGGSLTLQDIATNGSETTTSLTASALLAKLSYLTDWAVALGATGNGTDAYGTLSLREFSDGSGSTVTISSLPKTADTELFIEHENAQDTIATRDWARNNGGGSGANTALSNLASVAINTSLISDTDITDDLGSSSISWKDIFANVLKAGNGTISLPSISFKNSTNTGLWYTSASGGAINLSLNGVRLGYLNFAPAASANGQGNTFLGYNAGTNNWASVGTGGLNNTFVGGEAGQNNDLGQQNTFIGSRSGFTNTSGNQNTFIGQGAGNKNVSSSANATLGYHSGLNTTGSSNTYIGTQSGEGAGAGSSASSNTAVGDETLKVVSTGANNTALGRFTMGALTTSGQNTGVGTNSLFTITTGNGGNSAFGYQNSYELTSGTYNTSIGAYVQLPSNTTTGQLNIGNVIYGTGLYSTASRSSTPTTLGSIGIGLTTPTARLMLPAGTATASTAPQKFTSGTQLTTPEAGALETSGIQLKYSTSTTAASRGFVELGRYAATATSLTADEHHNVIDVTATGQTITLPTAVGIQGRTYTVKLTASGTGTVGTTSSQTIDGSTTYSLSAQYKYVTVMSDNANWIIIANN